MVEYDPAEAGGDNPKILRLSQSPNHRHSSSWLAARDHRHPSQGRDSVYISVQEISGVVPKKAFFYFRARSPVSVWGESQGLSIREQSLQVKFREKIWTLKLFQSENRDVYYFYLKVQSSLKEYNWTILAVSVVLSCDADDDEDEDHDA